jgi:hypothetical protein
MLGITKTEMIIYAHGRFFLAAQYLGGSAYEPCFSQMQNLKCLTCTQFVLSVNQVCDEICIGYISLGISVGLWCVHLLIGFHVVEMPRKLFSPFSLDSVLFTDT